MMWMVVLNKWKHDFQGLLTAPDDRTQEQKAFEKDIIKSNRAREKHIADSDNHNQSINRDFTKAEVSKIVRKAKSGKAPCIDGLIADVFKNERSISLLTEVFNCCLNNGCVPTDWTLGVINPIPKSGNNDTRVPLNYCCQ